ncbi:hypothetical protein R1flu_017867 [Riccia fluitans]|uniref:Uncharacterized protein n=1 Tax=Riccia fluitans TaxID=41844 RepID=A0ABD1ZE66_9MARC
MNGNILESDVGVVEISVPCILKARSLTLNFLDNALISGVECGESARHLKASLQISVMACETFYDLFC